MKITSLEIRNMTFPVCFRGYEKEAVHLFLETLAGELDAILQAHNSLKEQREEKDQQIAELKKNEASLTQILMLAQKAIDDIKSSSQREAELIIRNAEMRAEEVTQSAQKEASKGRAELMDLHKQKDIFVDKMKLLVQGLERTIQWNDREQNEPTVMIDPKER